MLDGQTDGQNYDSQDRAIRFVRGKNWLIFGEVKEYKIMVPIFWATL